jgi:GMP synthase-like glutamine amidotransferase
MHLAVWEAWGERKNMLVFIQSDPEVPAGVYAESLAETGIPFIVVELFDSGNMPPLRDTSAVVVLGGSMGIHDTGKHPFLLKVKDHIRAVLDSGKPYLGICLGGQLLADVLGAKVSTGSYGEVGTHSVSLTEKGVEDPLFRSVPGRFTTFQWHNDSFAIPEGADRLACSDICPNQAFRFGENAYGLQFHPEVNEHIVTAWCNGFDPGNNPPHKIISTFKDMESPFRVVSLQILRNFLDIIRSSNKLT